MVNARSRELADAAAHILRDHVRSSPLFAHDLAGWLLAAGFYHSLPPPDPLEIILLGDPRFTQTEDGKFALATKWEWIREREPDVIISFGLADNRDAIAVERFAHNLDEASTTDNDAANGSGHR